MTVSRVINGKRHVSEDTRERVNAAIAALSYSPNLTARSFSSAIRIGALYSNPASSNLGTFLMGAFRESGVSGCQFQIEPGVSEEEAIAGLHRLVEARGRRHPATATVRQSHFAGHDRARQRHSPGVCHRPPARGRVGQSSMTTKVHST
jgi:hypothetical protein